MRIPGSLQQHWASLRPAPCSTGPHIPSAAPRRWGSSKDKQQTLQEIVEENDWKNSLVVGWLPQHVQDKMPRMFKVGVGANGAGGGGGPGLPPAWLEAASRLANPTLPNRYRFHPQLPAPPQCWVRNFVLCAAVYYGIGAVWSCESRFRSRPRSCTRAPSNALPISAARRPASAAAAYACLLRCRCRCHPVIADYIYFVFGAKFFEPGHTPAFWDVVEQMKVWALEGGRAGAERRGLGRMRERVWPSKVLQFA